MVHYSLPSGVRLLLLLANPLLPCECAFECALPKDGEDRVPEVKKVLHLKPCAVLIEPRDEIICSALK